MSGSPSPTIGEMASLPSQPPQRRPSTTDNPFSSATQETGSQEPSSTSTEVEPVLLNPSTSLSKSATPSPTADLPRSIPTDETLTCWICQQDQTEDESPNVVWRKPCPCSLTAHDECLLEWIANEETPAKGEVAYNHTIKCPQCQTEIQIERPHDYLVAGVDRVQRFAKSFVLPTALSGIAGCFYSGLLVYGLNTMQVVFGQQEARLLLGVVQPDDGYGLGGRWMKLVKDTARWSLTAFDPFFPDAGTASNLKVFIGLPLIGPSLVISRTKFADQAFALLLPMVCLVSLREMIDTDCNHSTSLIRHIGAIS